MPYCQKTNDFTKLVTTDKFRLKFCTNIFKKLLQIMAKLFPNVVDSLAACQICLEDKLQTMSC